MTAATSFRSLGTTASCSTIDAIVSTSYGVRFFERAYERFTRAPLALERLQLRADELPRGRVLQEVVRGREQEALELPLLRAEAGDAPRPAHARGTSSRRSSDGRGARETRSSPPPARAAAICARVKPSGKTTRNGFGGGGAVVVTGLCEPPQPAAASTTTRATAWRTRTTRGSWRGDARRRARPRAWTTSPARRGRW